MKIKHEIIERSEGIYDVHHEDGRELTLYGRMLFLKESTLKRIESHMNTGFFVVSAFRSILTYKQNELRARELISKLNDLGLGYITLIGHSEEEMSDGTKRGVTEISHFVPYMEKYTEDQFKGIIDNFAVEYDQDSYLLCLPKMTNMLVAFCDGTTSNEYKIAEMYGKLNHATDLNTYYSRLKKGRDRKIRWVFEGMRTGSSYLDFVNQVQKGEIKT